MRPEIAAAIAADIPIMLLGPPGTGKTASVRAWAAEQGAALEVLIGSTLDPTDICRPIVVGDAVKLALAPWAERIMKREQPTWLFLDEFSCTPASVQAALLRVVHERAIGDVQLPSTLRIIAAANPADSAADFHDMSAAMANRWMHVSWNADLGDWTVGELSGWGTGSTAASAMICGFLSKMPQHFCVQPENGQDAQGWPSPRSWSNLGRVLHHMNANEPQAAIGTPPGLLVAKGLVGDAAAVALRAWVADTNLPDPKDLLSGKAKLPQRADMAHAALMACIHEALHNKRLPDLWKLLSTQRADIKVGVARQAVRVAEKMQIQPEYTPEFQEILHCLKSL